jgi:hypothetical protein
MGKAFYLSRAGMLRDRGGRRCFAARGALWEGAASSTASTDKCATVCPIVGFCVGWGRCFPLIVEGVGGEWGPILIHTQG